MIGCHLCQKTNVLSTSIYKTLYTNIRTNRVYHNLRRYSCNILQSTFVSSKQINRLYGSRQNTNVNNAWMMNNVKSRATDTRNARNLHRSMNAMRTFSRKVPEASSVLVKTANGFPNRLQTWPHIPITWNLYGKIFNNNSYSKTSSLKYKSQLIYNETIWKRYMSSDAAGAKGDGSGGAGSNRRSSSGSGNADTNHNTVLLYLTSAAVLVGGLSYACVPLYRLYCQASGYGSAQQEIDFGNKIEEMERVEERLLTIRFEAGTSKTLRWKFKPQQKEVKVAPGETALAFYTAENLTDEPIVGIATYNVIPFEAGQYFNKIQCFCFEEQQLNPNEEVDMPVFFYIDPEFTEDPKLAKYDELILSYTFFQSNEASAPGSSPHTVK